MDAAEKVPLCLTPRGQTNAPVCVCVFPTNLATWNYSYFSLCLFQQMKEKVNPILQFVDVVETIANNSLNAVKIFARVVIKEQRQQSGSRVPYGQDSSTDKVRRF